VGVVAEAGVLVLLVSRVESGLQAFPAGLETAQRDHAGEDPAKLLFRFGVLEFFPVVVLVFFPGIDDRLEIRE
jgi:hypothetical protein